MALLQLLRLPAVFTAMADILAGYLILRFAGAGEGEWRRLPVLALASACLYMAGMAWNDIFDAADDSIHRPERPLPAGQISPTVAFFIAAILSIAGLMLAMSAGHPCFFAAGVLLCAVLLYDSGAKRLEVIGPLAMAACRGLNLFLGMSCHPDAWFLIASPIVYLPMAMLAAYTAMVTVISALETPSSQPSTQPFREQETSPAMDSKMETEFVQDAPQTSAAMPPAAARSENLRGMRLDPIVLGLGGLGLLFIPIAGLLLFAVHPLSLLFFGLLFILLLVRIIGAWLHAGHGAVKQLVGSAIFGIVLLDAGMVAGVAQTAAEQCWNYPIELPDRPELAGIAMVAAMLLPMWALKRRIEIA